MDWAGDLFLRGDEGLGDEEGEGGGGGGEGGGEGGGGLVPALASGGGEALGQVDKSSGMLHTCRPLRLHLLPPLPPQQSSLLQSTLPSRLPS